MSKPSPRVAGLTLQVLAGVLQSPIVGPVLARALAKQSLEDALADLDLAAERDPAPFYMPPPYDPRGAGGSEEPR